MVVIPNIWALHGRMCSTISTLEIAKISLRRTLLAVRLKNSHMMDLYGLPMGTFHWAGGYAHKSVADIRVSRTFSEFLGDGESRQNSKYGFHSHPFPLQKKGMKSEKERITWIFSHTSIFSDFLRYTCQFMVVDLLIRNQDGMGPRRLLWSCIWGPV